jgi:hypothetical protein
LKFTFEQIQNKFDPVFDKIHNTVSYMPSKAQINRRRQTAQNQNQPKQLKYSSRFGISNEILNQGVDSLRTGDSAGFNAHYWVIGKNGKRIDPTPPHPQHPPLQCKNGSVKPYYKEFSEDIQQFCNSERVEYLENYLVDGDTTVEEYLYPYSICPEPMRCYQNCRAYIMRNTDCRMVCGAFGYILDIHPTPCSSELKKLKKYISLDFGY